MVPTPLNQLYTWGIFAVVSLLAWEGALGVGMARFNDDLERAKGVPGVVRRPYLIALVAYCTALAWFNIAFFMLILFCFDTISCMTAQWELEPWSSLILAAASPDVVFHCVDVSHMPWHAVVAGATLLAASLHVGFYLTDEDMLDEHATHSKVVRALFIAPALGCVAYAAYVTVRVLSAMS